MDEDNICTLCLEIVDHPLSCKHRVHLSCLIELGDLRCPYCRHIPIVTREASTKAFRNRVNRDHKYKEWLASIQTEEERTDPDRLT